MPAASASSAASTRASSIPTATAETAQPGDPVPSCPGAQDEWPKALSGAARGENEAGARIYSKARFLWIRPEPSATRAWIGYLSLGDSVRLRGGDAATARLGEGPAAGGHCRGWYAVEPRGYVCLDEQATLDPTDPVLVELRKSAARAGSPWPFDYGESIGTPFYATVPDEAAQRRTEADLDQHLDRVHKARAARSPTELGEIAPELLGVELGPTGELPPPPIELSPRSRSQRRYLMRGSTLAFTRSFDSGGRSWLLTWDWAVVPRDRVRPYPRSCFHGVALGGAIRLPIAFFRRKPRPQYRRAPDGALEPTGKSWPRHGWVKLTGESTVLDGRRYLATSDGLFCAEEDATAIHQAERIPPRVTTPRRGRQTWLDISVLGGWLVAYEADRPVYATLISPGRGGMPYPGIAAVETASTPVGQFTVTGKFLTATMVSSSDANLVHAEVPYTQNFSGPHALHGAYWHDGWGEKMSGGCVNLSPIDAQRIFAWTEPQLPAGWHGVRWVAAQSGSTVVLIHR